MLWQVVVEWLSRLVLVLLVGLSIWSIAIIFERWQFFKARPKQKLAGLKQAIRQGNFTGLQSLSTDDPFSKALVENLAAAPTMEKRESAYQAFVNEQRPMLEKGLPVLGSLGSTSPFIGLLGTILGIIVSFGKLSQGEGSTNAVMFSLAEALILTAVGLLVAIPAVLSFNYFSRQVRLIFAEAQAVKDLYNAFKE